jgi:uncharacterized protein
MSGKPYTYDPAKAAKNLRDHRVSFDDGFAVLIQDEALLWQFLDQRNDYGEDRWIVIGPLPGFVHTLLHITWTERDENIHLISVRRVTSSERRSYANRHRRPY